MYVRLLAAVAVTVSAMLHLKMWFDGVRDQSVGPAFMVNAIGGVVIAVLLLTWDHWVPAFLTLGFGLSTLGAFIISTTVGLMGVHSHWEGFAVYAAAVSEVVCIVVGAMLLLASRTHRTLAGSRAPGRRVA